MKSRMKPGQMALESSLAGKSFEAPDSHVSHARRCNKQPPAAVRTPTVVWSRGNNLSSSRCRGKTRQTSIVHRSSKHRDFADELETRKDRAVQRTTQAVRSRRMMGRRAVRQTADVLLVFTEGVRFWVLVCYFAVSFFFSNCYTQGEDKTRRADPIDQELLPKNMLIKNILLLNIRMKIIISVCLFRDRLGHRFILVLFFIFVLQYFSYKLGIWLST